jgi:hypothetical protein
VSQGQGSEDVLGKMATTFIELAKRADFSSSPAGEAVSETGSPGEAEDTTPVAPADGAIPGLASRGMSLGGLVYNIEIHLPDTRDQAVYDALFRSLKSHLLQ